MGGNYFFIKNNSKHTLKHPKIPTRPVPSRYIPRIKYLDWSTLLWTVGLLDSDTFSLTQKPLPDFLKTPKMFGSWCRWNRVYVYQLDFIQAFIQSEAKTRMFLIFDKEYGYFCPKLAGYFGRPLKLKKCLYGADFSGKSW